MENITHNLTLFWSLYFIIWALFFSFYPGLKFNLIEWARPPKKRLLIAFIVIIIGGIHVILHNNWEEGFGLWITVFGWVCLVEGILFLIWPGLLDIGAIVVKSRYFNFFLLVMYVLGLFFFMQWLNTY